jgi:hypothetical protein
VLQAGPYQVTQRLVVRRAQQAGREVAEWHERFFIPLVAFAASFAQ